MTPTQHFAHSTHLKLSDSHTLPSFRYLDKHTFRVFTQLLSSYAQESLLVLVNLTTNAASRLGFLQVILSF